MIYVRVLINSIWVMYYSLVICEWNSHRALIMSRSVSHGPV